MRDLHKQVGFVLILGVFSVTRRSCGSAAR
uniref:Uncharacterized protein n=1 Tax=Arundo donax TaxID=35708 RepID=A0A0A9F203_ARUDO